MYTYSKATSLSVRQYLVSKSTLAAARIPSQGERSGSLLLVYEILWIFGVIRAPVRLIDWKIGVTLFAQQEMTVTP